MSASTMEEAPRFIADAMLGALARWLWALDLDVLYDPALDDPELVERAMAEERIILTRDRRLVLRRRARRHLLIHSDDVGEQVREVRTQQDFRRCPACDRLYWRATHVERMRRRLLELVAGIERAR